MAGLGGGRSSGVTDFGIERFFDQNGPPPSTGSGSGNDSLSSSGAVHSDGPKVLDPYSKDGFGDFSVPPIEAVLHSETPAQIVAVVESFFAHVGTGEEVKFFVRGLTEIGGESSWFAENTTGNVIDVEKTNEVDWFQRCVLRLLKGMSLLTKEQLCLWHATKGAPLWIAVDRLQSGAAAEYYESQGVIVLDFQTGEWSSVVHEWFHLAHDLSVQNTGKDEELLAALGPQHRGGMSPGMVLSGFPSSYSTVDLCELFAEVGTRLWLQPTKVIRDSFDGNPQHRKLALYVLELVEKLLPGHAKFLSRQLDANWPPSEALTLYGNSLRVADRFGGAGSGFDSLEEMSLDSFVDHSSLCGMPYYRDFDELLGINLLDAIEKSWESFEGGDGSLRQQADLFGPAEQFGEPLVAGVIEQLLIQDGDNELNILLLDAFVLYTDVLDGRPLNFDEQVRYEAYRIGHHFLLHRPESWGQHNVDKVAHGCKNPEAFNKREAYRSELLRVADQVSSGNFAGFDDDTVEWLSQKVFGGEQRSLPNSFDSAKIVGDALSRRDYVENVVAQMSLLGGAEAVNRREAVRAVRDLLKPLEEYRGEKSPATRLQNVGSAARLAPAFANHQQFRSLGAVLRYQGVAAAKLIVGFLDSAPPWAADKFLADFDLDASDVRGIATLRGRAGANQTPPTAMEVRRLASSPPTRAVSDTFARAV